MHQHKPARARLARCAAAAALATLPGWAMATNGYFPHGFGLKAKGMGGASIAMTHDAFAGVNNPAASAFIGNRWDLGGELFMPSRDAQMVGMSPVVESGRKTFLIPEFGYNTRLSDRLGVGITVYGNGGMNTSYGTNILFGAGKLGVDLMQLIIAPTVAYQVAPGHALGVSPLLVMQRFEATGLQAFAGMSGDPANVTNRGKDTSTGVGLRVGYMGQIGDGVTVGASYSPRIGMSRFKRYAGLFAGGGDFDIPENYGVGVAIKVARSVTVAVDATRINYSGVPSIGNPSAGLGGPLGAANGPGFGWRDVSVLKIGAQWEMNNQWTLRAGYNRGTNPIQPADVMFNILAPGVIREHLTLGGTYAPDASSEWTFALWHGRRQSVTGPTMVPAVNATIGMSQNGIGLQYSRKF